MAARLVSLTSSLFVQVPVGTVYAFGLVRRGIAACWLGGVCTSPVLCHCSLAPAPCRQWVGVYREHHCRVPHRMTGPRARTPDVLAAYFMYPLPCAERDACVDLSPSPCGAPQRLLPSVCQSRP
jgi:hypothetical protein